MDEFYDELEASVGLGSGLICLVGPPACGKTTQLLDFLVRREASFDTYHRQCVGEASPPSLHIEYVSARSAPTDVLGPLMRRLQFAPARRRVRYEGCNPASFASCVTQWLTAQAPRSELHLVIDDADLLSVEAEAIDTWLSGCLGPREDHCTVYLWLVSQLPLRLCSCFRYHVLGLATTDIMIDWLTRQFDVMRPFLSRHDSESDVDGVVTWSAAQTQSCVLQAFRYYATHQPMSASVICKDGRTLLQRTYALLPALLSAATTTTTTAHAVVAGGATEERGHATTDGARAACSSSCAADSVSLGAIGLSHAWGGYARVCASSARRKGHPPSSPTPDSADAHGGASDDSLVPALRQMGYGAVLFAFAAFYCGAVPVQKQLQVFASSATGADGQARRRTVNVGETKAQSHRAAVLSAAAHVVTLPQLLFVYAAMRRMCAAHIDVAELTTPELAAHFVGTLLAWGLLTPVLTQRARSYHCWIAVSTALQLGRTLSLSLYDLIPS